LEDFHSQLCALAVLIEESGYLTITYRLSVRSYGEKFIY